MVLLIFAPSSNKNNKSNKKSSKNNTSKGKKRSVPQKKSAGRKSSDEGMKALMASVLSNVSRRSQVPSVTRPLPTASAAVKLSKCSAKYAYAISDPFSPIATGVCVPSGQATASHKVTGFVRVDSKIGTQGFAFIAISPSGARDAPQLIVSNAGYFPSTVAILNNTGSGFATGLNVVSVSNLPYTADNLINKSGEDSQEVTSRVVSAGVSVQYTGTALNQSGMAYLYRDPAHKNVSITPGTISNASISSLSSNPLTTVCNFTRERCMVSDFASNSVEMNFIGNSDLSSGISYRTSLVYPFSGGEGDLSTSSQSVGTLTYSSPAAVQYYQGVPTTIICVTGQPGQDFHVEYVVHVEYIGNLAAASYTPTDSDIQGAGMVLEAANGIQQRKTSKPEASTWSLMYEGLAYAAKKAAPVVIPLAERAIMSLLA